MKEFFLKAKDGLNLSIALFENDTPKALVQIIHGSVEHKERYYPFAQFLNNNGYTVIVSDNRGHGQSLNSHYTLGYMDDYSKIIDDQYMISGYIKNLNPNKKLYLLGHSLGSVFARIYLEKHDDMISKLVLSGTVFYDKFTPLGILLAHIIILFKGKRAYNNILRKLVKNDNNVCWISNSLENRVAYQSDPLCGYPYPNESCLTLMKAVRELDKTKHFYCKNPNLEILSITGEDDPVAGGRIGLESTFKLLHKIGYHNFKDIVYPGMSHEVLNEMGHLLVFKNVLDFFDNGITPVTYK